MHIYLYNISFVITILPVSTSLPLSIVIWIFSSLFTHPSSFAYTFLSVCHTHFSFVLCYQINTQGVKTKKWKQLLFQLYQNRLTHKRHPAPNYLKTSYMHEHTPEQNPLLLKNTWEYKPKQSFCCFLLVLQYISFVCYL